MTDQHEYSAYKQLQTATSQKFKLILLAAESANDHVVNHSFMSPRPGTRPTQATEAHWEAIGQRDDATKRALSFSSEFIATEAGKAPGYKFSNHVEKALAEIGETLDQRIPAGPAGLEKRRAYLAYVEETLPSSAHWKPTAQHDEAAGLARNLAQLHPTPRDLLNRETGQMQRGLSILKPDRERRNANIEYAENLTQSVAQLHTAVIHQIRSSASPLRGIPEGQAHYTALATKIDLLPKDANSTAFEQTKAAREARFSAAKPRVFSNFQYGVPNKEGRIEFKPLQILAKDVFEQKQMVALNAERTPETPIRKRPAEPVLNSPNTSTRALATPGPWIKRQRVGSQSEISSTTQNATQVPTASQQLGDAAAGPSRQPSTPPSVTSGWITRPNAPSLRPAQQNSVTTQATSSVQSTALDSREGERSSRARDTI